MGLSSDLISQFVKATKSTEKPNGESTVYGTIVEHNSEKYVKLDGSDLLTPIASTTVMEDGDRVLVTIKNHAATVTGNITSPSASNKDVIEIGNKITEFEIVIADKVSTKELGAQVGRIDDLVTDNIQIKETLTANQADIDELKADNVTINGELTANKADIDDLKVSKLDANVAEAKYATIENLEATNTDIHNLTADYGEFQELTTGKLAANEASIKELETNKLSSTEADLKYANIDFSNIGKAAMEYFYTNSGLIKNVIIGDAEIAGELIGVTIRGDLIEGNTVVADKLVIKGEDGLYYKLNTDGVTTETEQTDYNSLNGQVIRAKSVTAEKIAVEDLVAFDATIGGFNITKTSIYSGVKESVDNSTRGIYLDRDGQVAFGDSTYYLKYYRDNDGNYKLAISAGSITFSTGNKNLETMIDDIQEKADAAVIKSIEQFYQSDSSTELTGGSWSVAQPVWKDGKYIWRRTKVTYGNGNIEYTPSEIGVCITGNTGTKGEDSTLLRIESSRGTVFKNDTISTVLSVVIYHGSQRITDSAAMKSVFGNSAYIQWNWQRLDDSRFGTILTTDSRLSNDGFSFTLSPEDVDTKVTFLCQLITD